MKYDVTKIKNDNLVMIHQFCKKYKLPFAKIQYIFKYFVRSRNITRTDYINNSIMEYILFDFLKEKREESLDFEDKLKYSKIENYNYMQSRIINLLERRINNGKSTVEVYKHINNKMHWKHIKRVVETNSDNKITDKVICMYVNDAIKLHNNNKYRNDNKFFTKYLDSML